jgi:hypothetical protein
VARSCRNCCSGKAISITLYKCACSLSYPACNAHAPYCHLRPLRLYYIFPHYLIHGTIVVRNFVNMNSVLWFSPQLLFETFLGAFSKLRKTTISFVMSVRLSVCLTLCLFVCPSVCPHKTQTPLDGSSWYLSIFENLSRKFRFHWSRTRITGILHEDQYTFLTISRSFLLRMRNVSDSLERNSKNI